LNNSSTVAFSLQPGINYKFIFFLGVMTVTLRVLGALGALFLWLIEVFSETAVGVGDTRVFGFGLVLGRFIIVFLRWVAIVPLACFV
jgi:hypothetical protein